MLSRMILPVAKTSPTNLLKIIPNAGMPRQTIRMFRTAMMRITLRQLSTFQWCRWCLSSDSIASDVESLKRGIIKTSENAPYTNAPYTILLLGETGVGKSLVLEFIANVLRGNDIDYYDFNTLNQTNERGGSASQSQTNSSQLYDFRSRNDVWVSASSFQCGKLA